MHVLRIVKIPPKKVIIIIIMIHHSWSFLLWSGLWEQWITSWIHLLIPTWGNLQSPSPYQPVYRIWEVTGEHWILDKYCYSLKQQPSQSVQGPERAPSLTCQKNSHKIREVMRCQGPSLKKKKKASSGPELHGKVPGVNVRWEHREDMCTSLSPARREKCIWSQQEA